MGSSAVSEPARTEGGRIVVGVDGSAASGGALRWALQEAKLRGVPLCAVHAWEFHPSWADPGLGSMFPIDFAPGGGSVAGMPADLASDTGVSTGKLGAVGLTPGGRSDTQSRIAAELDHAVADAVAAEREIPAARPVKITQAVVEGHPARVLLDNVTASDLLVVGSRGHRELAGTLLGSISQHLVTHAPCPVVVIPHPAREGAQTDRPTRVTPQS
jgi:nucleotide-binding universal stress UspA family protein